MSRLPTQYPFISNPRDSGDQAAGRQTVPIFELPEQLCECDRQTGEGFWCDYCGGCLPEPGFAPKWLVCLVVGVGVLWMYLLLSCF